MVPEGGQQSAPPTACRSTAARDLPGRSVSSPHPHRAQGRRSARAFTPPRAESRARWCHPHHQWGRYHGRALGGPQADRATSRTGDLGPVAGGPTRCPRPETPGPSAPELQPRPLGELPIGLIALTHASLRIRLLPFRPALDGPEQPSRLGAPGLERGPGRPGALPFPPEKSATVSKVKDPSPRIQSLEHCRQERRCPECQEFLGISGPPCVRSSWPGGILLWGVWLLAGGPDTRGLFDPHLLPQPRAR